MGAESRLHIAYVGTLPPHSGGSATVGGQLVAGFAARGHRVTAIAPLAPGARDAAERFARDHGDVRITRYAVPHDATSPDVPQSDAYDRSEGAAVRAALDALVAGRRPDVVVSGRESFAAHVPAAARGHGLPCVQLVQGSTTFGMLRGTIPPGDRQPLLDAMRAADRVVAVARHIVGPLRTMGLGDVVAVPNGVDTRRFAPGPRRAALLARLAIPSDAVVVGHLSNLKALKRTGDLVAAAAPALRGEPRLLFLVVGDGPLRADLQRSCARAGVGGRFRFTGWVPHERVPDHLNLCDLVVMPSGAEALAMAYLETMACGRALLASDIPAAREVIRHGETGLLFPMGDRDALAAALLRAARDPGLRADVGRRARAAALRRDVAHTVDAHLRVLREVVARHRGLPAAR